MLLRRGLWRFHQSNFVLNNQRKAKESQLVPYVCSGVGRFQCFANKVLRTGSDLYRGADVDAGHAKPLNSEQAVVLSM